MKIRTTAQVVGALGVCAAIAVCIPWVAQSTAENADATQVAENEAAPIYGVIIPPGYRDWRLIAVAELVAGKGHDPALAAANMGPHQLRAQLGNDIAIKAFREGTLPFPDGAIIAALHWNEVASDTNDKVLAVGFPGAGLESSVPGSAANVQFMVKDSKKYAATC
jgi:hypothetical protein